MLVKINTLMKLVVVLLYSFNLISVVLQCPDDVWCLWNVGKATFIFSAWNLEFSIVNSTSNCIRKPKYLILFIYSKALLSVAPVFNLVQA